MFKIGLTGGIGSGKTAASDHFAHLGAEVIDTDLLSRELVEPGQPALVEIIEVFGNDVIDGEGRLDRAGLRERVFADEPARKQLEAILHPRIRREMLHRANTSDAPYAVLVIPLLIETGQQALVDRVLLIDAPETTQHARVAARDGMEAQQIDAILRAQSDNETRRRLADDIIVNDASLAELHAAVRRLHEQYLHCVEN